MTPHNALRIIERRLKQDQPDTVPVTDEQVHEALNRLWTCVLTGV